LSGYGPDSLPCDRRHVIDMITFKKNGSKVFLLIVLVSDSCMAPLYVASGYNFQIELELIDNISETIQDRNSQLWANVY